MSQEQMAETIPIVIYIDGVWEVIGQATVDEDEVVAQINPILGDKILEAVKEGTLSSISIGFNREDNVLEPFTSRHT